ncbi:hypothetical protein BCR39DRAFT_518125 [Naematelia encephala]|uniref:F-box domain-containing protein n=1 Tax=Naematelia encephala TaxID=71784 RepID=A0A1Y2BGT4_9TREE|nr:hypothetical protein BCR39DRAFT_518125 [Naematelia encephala]
MPYESTTANRGASYIRRALITKSSPPSDDPSTIFSPLPNQLTIMTNSTNSTNSTKEPTKSSRPSDNSATEIPTSSGSRIPAPPNQAVTDSTSASDNRLTLTVLPPRVLSQVLRYLHEPEQFTDPSTGESTTRSPLKGLSLASKEYRTLTAPELFSRIHVPSRCRANPKTTLPNSEQEILSSNSRVLVLERRGDLKCFKGPFPTLPNLTVIEPTENFCDEVSQILHHPGTGRNRSPFGTYSEYKRALGNLSKKIPQCLRMSAHHLEDSLDSLESGKKYKLKSAQTADLVAYIRTIRSASYTWAYRELRKGKETVQASTSWEDRPRELSVDLRPSAQAWSSDYCSFRLTLYLNNMDLKSLNPKPKPIFHLTTYTKTTKTSHDPVPFGFKKVAFNPAQSTLAVASGEIPESLDWVEALTSTRDPDLTRRITVTMDDPQDECRHLLSYWSTGGRRPQLTDEVMKSFASLSRADRERCYIFGWP